jgi:hypothetical protein
VVQTVVRDEAREGVDCCEDEHDDELEESEDVGSYPHGCSYISRTVGAFCWRVLLILCASGAWTWGWRCIAGVCFDNGCLEGVYLGSRMS